MSEERQHHHIFRHKKGNESDTVVYAEVTTRYSDEVIQRADVSAAGELETLFSFHKKKKEYEEYEKAKEEGKQHKHGEHLGEMGTSQDKRKAKKEAAQCHKQKVKKETAAAAPLEVRDYVIHKHHEKKESKTI